MNFLGIVFKNPDFLSYIVKENQAITVYRPMANEKGAGNINKIRFGVPENQKTIFSRVGYLIFFFNFFSQTLNLLSLLNTDQNRSNSVNPLSLAANLLLYYKWKFKIFVTASRLNGWMKLVKILTVHSRQCEDGPHESHFFLFSFKKLQLSFKVFVTSVDIAVR